MDLLNTDTGLVHYSDPNYILISRSSKHEIESKLVGVVAKSYSGQLFKEHVQLQIWLVSGKIEVKKSDNACMRFQLLQN